LHRLESEGLLKTEKINVGNRVRKYYMLTPTGKSTANERVSEFVEFIKTMGNVLQVNLG
jgi:PadR family transcriptional regulator, regulatory protein PadR